MRILAFTKYGALAASARQRLLQYLPFLEAHGVHVELRPLLDDDHMRRLARGERASPVATIKAYGRRLLHVVQRTEHDLLWVQYELFPYLPGLAERLAGRGGRPLVLDYDDAIFHQYDAHTSRLVRLALGRKLVPLLESASACICGNEYLRSHISRYCQNSVVIPTVVDTSTFRPGVRAVASAAPPVVGWIGSPSTWRYVEPLLPVLRDLVTSGRARVRVVGAGESASRHTWLTSVPWSEATEVGEVQRMDIGIMPVPDDLWARGKCGYKLIQYMACGLPVVASPVGVNTAIVTDGANGFLASSESQWRDSLTLLLERGALRSELGLRGRQLVEQEYSLVAQRPRVLDVLRHAIGAQRAHAP